MKKRMKKKLKLFILRLKLYIYGKLSEMCRKKMARTFWNEKRVQYLFKKYNTESEINKEET